MRCTFTPEVRGHLRNLRQFPSSPFKSGRWSGSYRQFEMDHPQLLDVDFENGVMLGTGADQVGLFLIAGRYNDATATAEWLKHYIGRHTVLYSGRLSGTTLSGAWTLHTELEMLTGSFLLMHLADQS